MSRNLPPFAIALKQRQENQNVAPKAPQARQFYPEYEDEYTYLEDSREFDESTYNETESESQPKPKSTKKKNKSKNNQKYNKQSVPPSVQKKSQYTNQQTNEPDQDYLAELEDYRNLLVDLQKKNTELETQVSDLTAENATLQSAQQDLIKERQISDDYFKQIEELKDALRDEQIKSKCFKEQVTQLESIVQSKNQQIEAKESMIHSINSAYNQMVSEYQANGLLVGTLTGQIRQYTKQISELETQIAELKSHHRNQNLTKRYETCIDMNSYQQNFDTNPPPPVDSKFNSFYPPPENGNFNELDSNPMPTTFNDFGSNQNGFNEFNSQPNAINDFSTKQTAFNDFNSQANAFNDFGPKPSGLADFNSQQTGFNDFGSKQNAFNDFGGQPNDFNSPPNLYGDFPDAAANNFQLDDQSRMQPPPDNQNDIFGTQQMPKQSATAAVKRSALVDNIQFEDPHEIKHQVDEELDLQSMSTNEMKEKLLSLQKERDEIERILNKAPPKGRLLAHVNREKEEKERQLDALIKQISKIKYRLKVIKAL